MDRRIVTAESVTSGHPDKLADLIADTILDRHLEHDATSRVAIEVMLSGNNVFVVGEVISNYDVDYKLVAEQVIASVGYSTDNLEYDIGVRKQSTDIANAVVKADGDIGAGDQGIVFGYASDETVDCMPLPTVLAHKLTNRLTYCRERNIIQGLLPDGKAQVSIEYLNNRINRIVSVVLSAQHQDDVVLDVLREQLRQHVIEYVFADIGLDDDTTVDVNPSGRFVLGGFQADSGVTGRKIIVDSYGGSCHHGGGAYSGKDATKVDRSGAYLARYIAKNIVASGLSDECEVAISYAIGKSKPTSIDINTFYTNAISQELIRRAVSKVFDYSVSDIIDKLELTKPVYAQTAVGGHFGKESLRWEQLDQVEQLKTAVKQG